MIVSSAHRPMGSTKMQRLTFVTALAAILIPLWGGSAAAGRMAVAAEPRVLTFPGGDPQQVTIRLQLVEIATGRPVHRGGALYLTSSYQGIGYPSGARLSARGAATLRLTVRPPTADERERLGGSITVIVIIDEEEADDTIEGRAVFLLGKE